MKRWICASLALALAGISSARADAAWDAVLARAKGETVFWNAWGGDERTNAFIVWVGEQVRDRYGVTLKQVKLTDPGEAVARVGDLPPEPPVRWGAARGATSRCRCAG